MMRDDKDFVVGMNTLGHAMASLFKSFSLVDTSDHEGDVLVYNIQRCCYLPSFAVSHQFQSHL